MEQALRAVITQLAVMAWQGKFKEASELLRLFCDCDDKESFAFVDPICRERVRDCICSKRGFCVLKLRKVSEKQLRYTASDAIGEIMRGLDFQSLYSSRRSMRSMSG